MLAGQRAFGGEDVSDTLANVLKTEPDWHAVPLVMSPALRRLLSRCLKKDSRSRLQAVGDARIEIEELLSGGPEPVAGTPVAPSGPGWRGVVSVVVGVFLFAHGRVRLAHRPIDGRRAAGVAVCRDAAEGSGVQYQRHQSRCRDHA
jgi:hypothetical protein